MKTFVVILFILGAQANAAEKSASPCLNIISQNHGFPTITSAALTCMKAKFEVDSVSNAISGLCSKDGKSLSANYVKYRAFETKLDALMKRYLASKDAVEQNDLQNQMNDLENAWMISGVRDEIAGYLNEIASTIDGCATN